MGEELQDVATTPSGASVTSAPALAGRLHDLWSFVRPWVPFLAVFLLLSLGWGAMATRFAEGAGQPLSAATGPTQGEYIDAFWHLGTGFLLALPTRDRRLLLITPCMSLGLDADHVFGLFLPSAVPRPDHSLLFALLAAAVAYAWKGPLARGATIAAIFTHFAVDGGTFPFLDPLTFARWPLSIPASAALLLGCGTLLLLLQGTPRGWRDTRAWVELAVIVAALTGFLVWIGPVSWLRT